MTALPGSRKHLVPGTLLWNERYRVGAMMAEGGMGAVYRAWDLRTNASVAIKEMYAPDDISPTERQALDAQFLQEAKTMAALDHPNLVHVVDFFSAHGTSYLVMDYQEGDNLEDLVLERGALPEQDVVRWAVQLLDALEHCHSRGYIHRDIKPQNLIVRSDNSIVLVDFGLTKTWSPQSPGNTASVIKGMGSPGFAPPEQYGRSSRHTDARSDVYGVGATMYYCLTGTMPADAAQRQVEPGRLVPIQEFNPTIDARVSQAVTQAMELTITDRFQSAREMRQALTQPPGRHPAPLSATLPVDALAPDDATIPAAYGAEFTTPAPKTASWTRGTFWAWVLGGASVLGLMIVGMLAATGQFGQDQTIISADRITRDVLVTATQTLPGASPTSVSTHSPTTQPLGDQQPTAAPSPTPSHTPPPPPTSTPTRPPAPTPTFSSVPRPKFYAEVISELRLRVRDGPSTDYEILDHVYTGDCVSVWDWNVDASWYRVRTPSNIEGWLSSEWVYGHTSSRCDGQVITPPGVQATFTVSPDIIRPSQCVRLEWNISGAQKLALDFAPRPLWGALEDCARDTTHTYLLRVTLNNGDVWIYPQTVVVEESAAIGNPTPPPLSAPDGTLSFRVNEMSRWCTDDAGYAIEFWLEGSGGTGSYVYSVDGQKVGGPMRGGMTYKLTWTTCSGASHTFHVESGDAQAGKQIQVNPPDCCKK